MIPALALSGLPLLLGAGAVALALFKDLFTPFKFPPYRAKNPREVTMLTDKQKKKLPKYAREAIDRLESVLAEANAAHADAVEKGTAEIRRLEARARDLTSEIMRIKDGEPGDVHIKRGLMGDFFARIRLADDFAPGVRAAEARGPTPERALSKALRVLGGIAMKAKTAVTRTPPPPPTPSDSKPIDEPVVAQPGAFVYCPDKCGRAPILGLLYKQQLLGAGVEGQRPFNAYFFRLLKPSKGVNSDGEVVDLLPGQDLIVPETATIRQRLASFLSVENSDHVWAVAMEPTEKIPIGNNRHYWQWDFARLEKSPRSRREQGIPSAHGAQRR